ncbi:hypothetical protein LOTGIDRAFT_144031 [Lottia gigantea]|uniref:DNA mismatch repair protein S5 domain-containing protein n=1 Tax=Lottia gigantea TaxID=225164 RepID=V4C485_LOTGI|nr:hypothetical protein LOTGIDRAFT_144031 [Lottia gigantea]ESO96339.1 hypothetical protein LOTGIDRAFT_144031 [Lottia gigantea]
MADKSLLTPLPASTIRLIGSSQVITSVYSVVKELLENCFDAHAIAVDVKLENYGLDKIEIKDNGDGIKTDDIQFVGQRHYTSKISSHDDLQQLQTYGFRGEALASLCSVSEVSITTKTVQDEISIQYKLTGEGKIKDSLPSHLGQGTTICAVNLFKNLPVRKQYHNTNKKKKVELKKIEDLLRVYSIVKPNVRITLRHNKELVFQKNAQPDTRAAILNVFGHQTVNLLVFCEKSDTETEIKLEMYLPKPGCDITLTSRASSDRSIISVNNRPVLIPDLDKVVRQYYSNCNGCDTTRYPVYYLLITVPTDRQDVNLDPNKTHIYLQDVVSKLLM